MVQTTRQPLLSMGTVPEWIGAIVLIGGLFWGGMTVISDMKEQLAANQYKNQIAIQTIQSSVVAIENSIEASSRITVLERAAAVSELSERMAGTAERVDRNWKNVDLLWSIVRKNEGYIRELRGK